MPARAPDVFQLTTRWRFRRRAAGRPRAALLPSAFWRVGRGCVSAGRRGRRGSGELKRGRGGKPGTIFILAVLTSWVAKDEFRVALRQPGGGVEVSDTLSRNGSAREKRVRRTLSLVEGTGNTISRFRPDSPVRLVTYRWRPAGQPGSRATGQALGDA